MAVTPNYRLAGLGLLLFLMLLSRSATASLAEREVLANGMILLIAERPGIPMVVITMLIKAGAAQDSAGQEGLANVTAELLTAGTPQRATTAIAEELDFLGAALATATDYDYTTVTLTTLRDNLAAASDLLADIVVSPTFPAEELDKKRREIQGLLTKTQEDPGWVAGKAFLRHLYHNHPYGRVIAGSHASLSSLTRKNVRDFHQAFYRPNNVIVAVVGDVTVDEGTRLIRDRFATWEKKPLPPLSPYPAVTGEAPRRIAIDKEVNQANIILGHRGIARDNPDYYAIRVMNYIFGSGGFGSRLMKRVREELGLAYSIGSSYGARKEPGPFEISLQTKNSSATQAIAEVLGVAKELQDKGVTEEELSEAKAFLINSFPLSLDSNREVAGLLPFLEFYNLGLDFPDRYPTLIGKVTKEDVQRVARTHLHPDSFLQVVVANLSQAGLRPSGTHEGGPDKR